MENKRKTLVKKIIAAVILMPIILFFMPMKLARASVKSVTADEYYIIQFISEGSTDGGVCMLLGDQNGIYDSEEAHYVTLTGNDMRDTLAFGIYNQYTEFIVYGSLTEKPDEKYEGYTNYFLNVECWDILGKINGGTHRRYLTIYDYAWTNKFLDDVGSAYYEQSLRHRGLAD